MSHPEHADLPRPLSADDLPDDGEALKAMVLELVETLAQCRSENQALHHRLDLLLRRLYGPRTERVDPNQRLLFPDTPAQPDQPAAPPAEAKPKRTCRPHGRRRLPENLPRLSRHYILTGVQLICSLCGQQREEIGLDKSEQLDYKPAALFVVEHIVHKYACPCCGKGSRPAPQQPGATPAEPSMPTPEPPTPSAPPAAPAEQQQPTAPTVQPPAPADAPAGQVSAASPVVIAAAKPAMPIAKGLPGPGLLAHLIVSKYDDHLPLHRLETIYQRQGRFLPRSTLCDWLLASGRLLRPLYDRLVFWVLLSRALHTDDTPVKLKDPKTHVLSTARMWAYLGDAAHPYNVFDFTLNRKRDGPVTFLANYQGYLHADAFSGYDCLYLPDPETTQARIFEVACNAHARRKFHEARTSDALRSHVALGYYRQLYELERAAKDFSEGQRLQMRQDLSVPILKKFRAWIEQAYAEVLPKSPMAEALGYARNNWAALIRYTESGQLDIDNNEAEREMKRIAIGRKNWLFVGSQQGGEMASVMMSFTSTCKRLCIEPWAYLQDVLTRLPTTPKEQLDELLPDRWQAAQKAKAAASTPAASGEAIPPAASEC
jgi:transposase